MKLLWLDFETTGLNPRHDRILEVAACVADLETPFDVGPVYEAVIGGPVHMRSVDPGVLDMHARSGLWDAQRTSELEIEDVEDKLIELAGSTTDSENQTTLAGSSVAFDLSFIRSWMPNLAACLHYRVYDVSSIALFCRSLGMPKPPKNLVHRAAADIRESIAIAKSCAAWLGRLPSEAP